MRADLTGRRGFLLGGLALGCSAAASPLLAPVAFAQAPWENRLVVVILRGGMDALDVVQPYGDRAFAALRPGLIGGLEPGQRLGEAGGAQDLDGFHALHPALSPLLPLWRAGELGFVQAVSTPYRDRRSHFDGQDILEAGVPGESGAGIRDGWLNRMLTTVPGVQAETAFAIGREQMLILKGRAPAAQWAPEARLGLSPQVQRLLDVVYHDDPLFRAASLDAIEIAQGIEADMAAGTGDETEAMMLSDPMMGTVTRNRGHVRLAEFAAARLRGETRIASFSLNGWDTHNRQDIGLRNALSQLSDTILTLRAGLGPVWDRTAVVFMTEFGRTARENGTRGTDHGTGGAMIYAGGAVRGGRVLGDWPGLKDGDLYAGRDLMPTRDVRAHAGWIMRGLFGLDAAVVENVVFPGLDLGGDPGLVL